MTTVNDNTRKTSVEMTANPIDVGVKPHHLPKLPPTIQTTPHNPLDDMGPRSPTRKNTTASSVEATGDLKPTGLRRSTKRYLMIATLLVVTAIVIGVTVPLVLANQNKSAPAFSEPDQRTTTAATFDITSTTLGSFDGAAFSKLVADMLNVKPSAVRIVSVASAAAGSISVTVAVDTIGLQSNAISQLASLATSPTFTSQYSVSSMSINGVVVLSPMASSVPKTTLPPQATLPVFTLPPLTSQDFRGIVPNEALSVSGDVAVPVFLANLTDSDRASIGAKLLVLLVNDTSRSSLTLGELVVAITLRLNITNKSRFSDIEDNSTIVDARYLDTAMKVMPTHIMALYTRLSEADKPFASVQRHHFAAQQASNLLVNGNFEDDFNFTSPAYSGRPTYPAYPTWFCANRVPGWNSTRPNGTINPNFGPYPCIEIDRGAVGLPYPDGGKNIVELDGYENTCIFQTVDVGAKRACTLRYWYQSRTMTSSSSMRVLQNNITINKHGGIIEKTWQKYSVDFNASSPTVRIEFCADGKSDSLGAFIDSLALECKLPPEYPTDFYCVPEYIATPYMCVQEDRATGVRQTVSMARQPLFDLSERSEGIDYPNNKPGRTYIIDDKTGFGYYYGRNVTMEECSSACRSVWNCKGFTAGYWGKVPVCFLKKKLLGYAMDLGLPQCTNTTLFYSVWCQNTTSANVPIPESRTSIFNRNAVLRLMVLGYLTYSNLGFEFPITVEMKNAYKLFAAHATRDQTNSGLPSQIPDGFFIEGSNRAYALFSDKAPAWQKLYCNSTQYAVLGGCANVQVSGGHDTILWLIRACASITSRPTHCLVRRMSAERMNTDTSGNHIHFVIPSDSLTDKAKFRAWLKVLLSDTSLLFRVTVPTVHNDAALTKEIVRVPFAGHAILDTVIIELLAPFVTDCGDLLSGVGRCSMCSFRCDGGKKCLESLEVCDRMAQCDDGTDEKFCGWVVKDTSCPFKCNNSACLSKDRVGDCIEDCPGGEDEVTSKLAGDCDTPKQKCEQKLGRWTGRVCCTTLNENEPECRVTTVNNRRQKDAEDEKKVLKDLPKVVKGVKDDVEDEKKGRKKEEE